MMCQGYPVVDGPNPQFIGLINADIDWEFKKNSILDVAKVAQSLLMCKKQRDRAETYAEIYYIASCTKLSPAKISNTFGTDISNLKKEVHC